MVVIGSRAPTSISELPGTVWVIEREQLDQQTQAGVPLKEALGQLIPAWISAPRVVPTTARTCADAAYW